MALVNNNFDTWLGITCPVYAVIDRVTLDKKQLSCWYDLDIYSSNDSRGNSVWPIKTVYFNIAGDDFTQKIHPVMVENWNVCQTIYEDCKDKLGVGREDQI